MYSVALQQELSTSDHNARHHRLGLAILLLLALVLLGCGSSEPPQVQVFPVSGKVVLAGGEVPVGARIVFYAASRSENLPAGIAPTGSVKPDGTFKLSVYGVEDGAPPGEYKVTIEWFKLVKEGEETINGPNVLPKEYANSATSPLKAVVQSSSTELPPFQIDPKKKS